MSISNSVAIRARELRKIYRLYDRPRYRLLDVCGLLRARSGHYREHAALDGVSLDIARGEKVAVIGRNGAGKSTLLKLVTGISQPSAGSLQVTGQMQALLQIGTGFHPDFTGRQNVLAYFEQLGIVRAEAKRRCKEVVDFAELEEYIDQPVKTYSTGMALRLMFSTSTAITPDLLVLDEILGVGDAYFAQKSFDRMRELCEREGTTLLLVSHDLYSASKLCDRMIWFDRGRIVLDGPAATVMTVYEDSIRQQEEHRLRLKHLDGVAAGRPSHGLLFEVFATQPAFAAPVYFSRCDLLIDGVRAARTALGRGQPGEGKPCVEGSSWGEPAIWQGRLARPMLPYGSVFHKVAVAFAVDVTAIDPSRFGVLVDCWCGADVELAWSAYVGPQAFSLGTHRVTGGMWQTLAAGVKGRATAIGRERVAGSGRVAITRVRAYGEDGQGRFLFPHGCPLHVGIGFTVTDPNFAGDVQVLATFHRNGVEDVGRVFCEKLHLEAAGLRSGEIRMRLPRVPFGVGRYTVSVGIAEAGYFNREQGLFYSINPAMFDCRIRALELEVVNGGVIASGTAAVFDGEWSLTSP